MTRLRSVPAHLRAQVPAVDDYPALLAAQLRIAGLPEPTFEFRFHPTRKWRYDCAFVEHKILLDVQGGIWMQGKHTRGAGYENDCRKLNAAILMGYRVLHYSPGMIESGEALADLERILK